MHVLPEGWMVSVDALLTLVVVVAYCVRHWCEDDLAFLEQARHHGVIVEVREKILYGIVRGVRTCRNSSLGQAYQ